MNCGRSVGRMKVKASAVASFSTTKNSSTKATGTIMGISCRAMPKVALVTPPVARATL